MTRTRFYKPMLAKSAEEPFSGAGWIFEVKWDGFRALAYVEEPFSLRSRNSKELKQNFPELNQLTGLASNVVLDGEIVVMENGAPDFQAGPGKPRNCLPENGSIREARSAPEN